MKSISRKKAVVIAAIVAFALMLVYILSVIGLSRMAGPGPKASVVFGPDAPHTSFPSLPLKIFAILSALILAYILPGVIWVLALWPGGEDIPLPRMMAWAFPVSIGLLIAAVSIFKLLFSLPLSRSSFLGLNGALMAIGLILGACLAGRQARKLKGKIHFNWSLKSAVPFIAFGFVILLFLGLFSKEILSSPLLDMTFSGGKSISGEAPARWDLFEPFGLAESLKVHLLPHWHLEFADKFGFPVVNPPLHCYLNLFALLLLGDAFGAVSITSALFIYVSGLVALGIISAEKEKSFKQVAFGREPAILILVIAIFGYFFLHESDPTTFVFPTHLFVLNLLLAFHFLLKGEFRLFLVYAFLASLARYAGLLVITLGVFFYWLLSKERRKAVLRAYGGYLALMALFFTFVFCASTAQGNLSVFLVTVKQEILVRFDYLGLIGPPPMNVSPEPKVSVANTISFLNWFLYGPVFLSIFFFLPKKDKTARVFSFTAIAYLLIILVSRHKRVHYVAPFVFMAAIVAARTFFVSKRKMIWVAVYLAAICFGAGWIWVSNIATQRINVALNPDSPAARYKLAQAYKERGMLGLAQRELQAILSQNPDDVDALLELGECYLGQGRYDEAERAFRRILELFPRHGPAKRRLQEIRSFYKAGVGR